MYDRLRSVNQEESEEESMLSIGEFSKICEVSTKTLRYYDEIELVRPNAVNPENGYRYYSVDQLETMLFINRLKSYNFSLEEIKTIISSYQQEEELSYRLNVKKKELEKELFVQAKILTQMENDLNVLKQGKSMMSYLDEIDVKLVEVPMMNLLSIRKTVYKSEIANQYGECFTELMKIVQVQHLTMVAPPMVLFHSSEFTPLGLDIEFAFPVKERVKSTRDFYPGLCIKTILKGTYRNLPSVYAKQCVWATEENYENHGALFEMYINDPSLVTNEEELITEIYYPIKKVENLK